VPLGGGGHRGGTFAGGKHDDAPCGRWRQVRRQDAVGMCRRDGSVEDGAQEFASVGHDRWGRKLVAEDTFIHPIDAKENPRIAGVFRLRR
jgi:hypothetical protein